MPESLFADTPVALLADAENGSRAFINPATGVFLTEKNLARQLADFLERAQSFSPRQWALENISCFQSSARLNEILKQDMLSQGQEWTQDIHPMCWRPDPRLVNPHDWQQIQPERTLIHEKFGLWLGPESGE